MSTIKLNGSNGISGYESDNVTLIVEKSISDLVGTNPEAFPSSQVLTLQNGVKVDGTATPPVLRFRDGSLYTFQGVRKVVLTMKSELDIYKATPYLTYDLLGDIFQGTDILGTGFYSTLGKDDWWQGSAPSMRFIGCGTNLFFTETTAQLQDSSGDINTVSLKSNVLNLTIKAPDGTILHSAPPVAVPVPNNAYDLEQFSPNVYAHMVTAHASSGGFPVYGYTLTLDLLPL